MVEPRGKADPVWGCAVARLRFCLLGPLEARAGGAEVNLGSYKQRVLLAALLCRANTVVSVDRLLDVVWGDKRPRTARKNLQVYVSALRKIAGERIQHVTYGYMLRTTDDEVDLLRFDRLAVAGRSARHSGDRAAARRLLGQAVALWRDRPMVDLAGNSFVVAESDRLTERYLAVYEDWVELEIEGGRQLDVLERLVELARQHPFRERLVTAAMTALSRSGGRRAALAEYEAHRQVLARELGLDPSPVVQRLYQDILAGAPARRAGTACRNGAAGGWHHAKPAQLPRHLPDFVGRDREVEQVLAALRGGRGSDVAVVSGMVGAGTTALAVRAGHLLAGEFTDGQVFVGMSDEAGRPRPWQAVLADLARSTGLDAALPPDEATATALWRSWVAGRHYLLVLDGATSEVLVRRLLPGSGGSRTLVAGPRQLGGLEAVHRVELGEFSPAEAFDLLERALGPARTRRSEAAVDALMSWCGSLPLVIRAVATKLTVLRHLTLRDYAEQLDRAREPIDELAVGGTPLRARFERFHDSLPPLAQQALRALGSLPCPAFRHGELLAALGAVRAPAGRLLEVLMEHHLVTAAGRCGAGRTVRYAMPVAAHRYAVALHRGQHTPGRPPG